LSELLQNRQARIAAAAVYEFAIDRFPDFAPLRVSLAVETGESWANRRRQTGCEDGVRAGPGSEAGGAGSSGVGGDIVTAFVAH
jgi:hypothetical protein